MVTAGLRVRNLTDSECPVPHSVHPTPSSHVGGDGVTQTASEGKCGKRHCIPELEPGFSGVPQGTCITSLHPGNRCVGVKGKREQGLVQMAWGTQRAWGLNRSSLRPCPRARWGR